MRTHDRGHAKRPWLPYVLLAVAALLAEWPVLTGREQFFLRDIGTTHRPAREAYARIGAATMNPYASFGQSYLGNPNLLVSYPFPKAARWLDLHILLHLAICFAGTVMLMRSSETSWDGAFFGATAFCLSGYVLSASSSLNATTTIAWIPWVLNGALLLCSSRLRWRTAACLVPLLALFSLSGEPALIAFTLLLAGTILLIHRAGRALLLFATAGGCALALTFPLHRATWAAASDSTRVAVGFSFERAMAASVHPARLVESITPYVFGNPVRIGPGAFWGYEVSRQSLPYVFSLHVSVLAIGLAIFALLRPRRYERIVAVMFVVCLVASMGGYLPGAETVYEALPWLHVLRFPIKLYLFATLALALLAARGFDRLWVETPGMSPNAIVACVMTLALLFGLAGILTHSGRDLLESWLVRAWWNPAWRSDPGLILRPILDSIPSRLLGIACLLAVAAWTASASGRMRLLIFHGVVVADLFIVGRPLMPTIALDRLREPSALVLAARRLPGRLYERAGKDLDAVMYGMAGVYTNNHASEFALAQHRQAWALSGVRYGLRYAYDAAPDASYTWRDEVVRKQLDAAPWAERLPWLRSVGVRAIVASESLPLTSVHPVAKEFANGVPVTLYAFNTPAPEVRRAARVLWASNASKAFALSRRNDFSPDVSVILEGEERELTTTPGNVELRRNDADVVEIVTSGDGPGVIFLARTFTSRVQATANGNRASVLPAHGHLIGILVPQGPIVLRVTFT